MERDGGRGGWPLGSISPVVRVGRSRPSRAIHVFEANWREHARLQPACRLFTTVLLPCLANRMAQMYAAGVQDRPAARAARTRHM
jgi:hypothetical protein